MANNTQTDTIQELRTRALELGVYLPLGAYAKVRDEIAGLNAPRVRKAFDDLIQRGEARMEPVERVIKVRTKKAEKRIKDVRKTTTSGAKTTKTTSPAKSTAKKTTTKRAPKKASELPIKA